MRVVVSMVLAVLAGGTLWAGCNGDESSSTTPMGDDRSPLTLPLRAELAGGGAPGVAARLKIDAAVAENPPTVGCSNGSESGQTAWGVVVWLDRAAEGVTRATPELVSRESYPSDCGPLSNMRGSPRSIIVEVPLLPGTSTLTLETAEPTEG